MIELETSKIISTANNNPCVSTAGPKIRSSNIGDMLITEEEITELFFEGKKELLLGLFRQGELKPVVTAKDKSSAFILREVISNVKKIYNYNY